jgi:V8-like Glu-specific endopeptidase
VTDVTGSINVSQIAFNAGQYGTTCRPEGTHYVNSVWVPMEWTGSDLESARAFDWAVLRLANPLANIPALTFAALPWTKIAGRSAFSIGYPSDKPGALTPWETGFSQFTGRSTYGNAGVLETNIQQADGASGSPVYLFDGGERIVVGVLVGSPPGACMQGRTWAAWLTPNVIERIQEAITGQTGTHPWKIAALNPPPDEPKMIAWGC